MRDLTRATCGELIAMLDRCSDAYDRYHAGSPSHPDHDPMSYAHYARLRPAVLAELEYRESRGEI